MRLTSRSRQGHINRLTGPALHPTDLAIKAGEFFSILGPSGSGKTTTLRLIAWDQTRFGFTPTVNAVFTCIGVMTLALVLLAEILIDPASKRSG